MVLLHRPMVLFLFLSLAILLVNHHGTTALEQVVAPQEETISVTADKTNSNTCTWNDCQDGAKYQDARLFPMKVPLDITSTEDETAFMAYIQPDVAEMYNQTAGSMAPMETTYNGVFAKFINLSPHKIRVDWEDRPGGNRVLTTTLAPFQAGATASYPGHRFIVYDDKTRETLMTWVVQTGNSLYTYDIFDGSLETAAKSLSSKDLELYKLQLDNLAFNKIYEEFTGRQWLALYKRKHAPRYPMWPADSFGQTHTVTTRETHLLELPPAEFAMAQTSVYGSTPEEREKLQQYRDPNQEIMILNMTVVSVVPRVFEIQNFLSPAEVNHIVEVATGMTLSESTTGSNAESRSKASGRTSRNSWIQRQRSVIIDSIHRRAADLLQMDQALFRRRFPNETDLVPETQASIAERLQLVHYDKGQQYTPHHDFMIPNLQDGQPSRFATILLYLNEPEDGGETSFPQWLNGKSRQILQVTPEVGKAVLFYNQLPDGNYDVRSLHAAKPVIRGEKWLTNFWIWDPHQ